MTENNLSDLLGFDPENGIRIENRDNLVSSQELSSEVGRLFLETYKDRTDILKIDPNKLFIASRQNLGGTTYIYREYYKYQGFGPTDPFEQSSSLHLGYIGRKINSLDISQFGETFSYDSTEKERKLLENVGISFDFARSYQTIIDSNMQDRSLHVFYDKQGVFSSLQFEALYNNQLIDFAKSLIEIKSLLGKDATKSVVKKNNGQVISVSGSRLNFSFINNGEIKDDFNIPLAINRKQLLGSFVNNRLLRNPISAPQELDYTWRSTNILDTVGVKWTRN